MVRNHLKTTVDISEVGARKVLNRPSAGFPCDTPQGGEFAALFKMGERSLQESREVNALPPSLSQG